MAANVPASPALEDKPLNRDRLISFDVDEVVDNLAKATNLRQSAMYKSYSGEGVANSLRAQKSLTNMRMSWEPKGRLLPVKVSNMDSYRRLRMQRVREYSMNKKLSDEMKKSKLQGSHMAKFKETDRVNDEQIHNNLRFQKNNIRERLKVRRDKSISKRVERSKSSFDINLRRGVKMEKKMKKRGLVSGKVTKSMVHKPGKGGFFLGGQKSVEIGENAMFPSGMKYATEADQLKEFLFEQNPENAKVCVELKNGGKVSGKRKKSERRDVVTRKSPETECERVKSASKTSRGRWSLERGAGNGMKRPNAVLVEPVVEKGELVEEIVKLSENLERAVLLEKEDVLKKVEINVSEIVRRVEEPEAEPEPKMVKIDPEEDLIGDLKMAIIRKDTTEQAKKDDDLLQELNIYESTVIDSHKTCEGEKEKSAKKEELPLVSSRVPEIKAGSKREMKRMEFEMKKKKRKRGNMWVPNSACKYEELKRSLFTNGGMQKSGLGVKTGSGSKKTSNRYGKVILMD